MLFITSIKLFANRSLYVDSFSTILGDIAAENELLSYSQSHEITHLLLYDLHIIHVNYDLTNPVTNQILASFISKAKNDYTIQKIVAIGENANFFTEIISIYNESRNNNDEKFDAYNLEFEFWNSESTNAGGYYCINYLEPNGFSCDTQGAFEFYTNTLGELNDLADSSTNEISIETYVGWVTFEQGNSICNKVNLVRLHAYVTDPNTAFNYVENRLFDFANANPEMNISIIFSAEASFMQNWLEDNSMLAAENTFITDWKQVLKPGKTTLI